MEKIKMGSGKELELIVCGINVTNDKATIKFLPGVDTLDGINTLLSDQTETNKMILLSEVGEELAIYNGYTNLCSISVETDAVIGYTQDDEQTPITGKLVTAVLRQPNMTEQRLASLEETVDTLVMESLGM